MTNKFKLRKGRLDKESRLEINSMLSNAELIIESNPREANKLLRRAILFYNVRGDDLDVENRLYGLKEKLSSLR